jgi:hypothetical protein
MNVAFEEILQVEAWTKIEGRRRDIEHTFDSIKTQIKDAVKEIKKTLICKFLIDYKCKFNILIFGMLNFVSRFYFFKNHESNHNNYR